MSSEASYLSDELKKAQARIADEKAKNGQLEHALASLRASFDAIQGVSLVQSVWRIRELEADASKAERNFRNQISAAQSKNAKQRTVLSGLQKSKAQARIAQLEARVALLDDTNRIRQRDTETLQRDLLKEQARIEELEKRNLFLEDHAASFAGIADDEVAKRREAEWRANSQRERIEELAAKLLLAEQKIKELESDAAARAKVRERLVESINVKAAQVQELEANLAFYQEKEEKDNAKIAQFIQRIQELALALERQRGHAKNLQFRLNEMPGNEALDRARCERDDALVRIKEMEGAIECLKSRVGNDEGSRRELSRKLDGRRTHILRLEKTVFNLEHFLAVAWKKIDELNAPK